MTSEVIDWMVGDIYSYVMGMIIGSAASGVTSSAVRWKIDLTHKCMWGEW